MRGLTSELRHHDSEVDAVRVHWAELGAASERPPLVLLHGLADSHLTWRAVVEDLARDRLVWMPDLPGHGLSERPDASYELQWHAHIVARWIEQRGVESVDVVGHSFGGGVAQMLLLECPERIRRIVLVASGGLGHAAGFWLKFATFPHFVEHYGQPFMAFGTRRALGRTNGPHAKEDVEALSAMNAMHGTARAFSRTARDVLDFGGQRRHFLHRAHEVAVLPPIALLWGERDGILPIEQGRAFVAQVEGLRFETFPNCGHYVHQDDPARFVAVVRDFLDDPTVGPVRLRPAVEATRPVASLARRALDAIASSLKRGG